MTAYFIEDDVTRPLALALPSVVLATLLASALAPPVAAAAGSEQVGRAPRESLSGFRMASEARLTVVFGDTAAYRRQIDRFHEVHGQMQTAREDFSRNVQLALSTLAASRGGKGAPRCPTDAVAPPYRRAHEQGQRYHELGKALEGSHAAIVELDLLGETSSLTPDYRWRVARALKLFSQVLRDFREMKLAFQQELSAELALFGCDAPLLMARGAELYASRTEPGAGAPTPAPGPTGADLAPLVTSATFFVDNATCAAPARVVLDGAALGEVGPRAKAAFRASVGPHELCLLPSSSSQACGAPGTLRRVHLHDGWAIELRCD